ncbi:MAG: hypothetical protein GY758_04215 [Fuerstiella sp.]|nr:hypothetical protein [Fuerstiella sp.]
MTEHTPGPWEWKVIDDELMLVPVRQRDRHWRRRNRVMEMGWAILGEAKEAVPPKLEDRRLIAAAPELLDCLEQLVEACDDAGWHMINLQACIDAIANAKGDQ